MEIEDFHVILEEQQDQPISSRDTILAGNNPEYREEFEGYVKKVLDEHKLLKEKGVLDSVEIKLATEHSVEIKKFRENGDITKVFNQHGIEMYSVISSDVYKTEDVIWGGKSRLNDTDINLLRKYFKGRESEIMIREGVKINMGKVEIDLGAILPHCPICVPDKNLGIETTASLETTRDKRRYIISSEALSTHRGMIALLHEIGHGVISDWYAYNTSHITNPNTLARRRQKIGINTYIDCLYVLKNERLADVYAINSYRPVLEKDGWTEEEIGALGLIHHVYYVRDMNSRLIGI